MKRDVCLGKPTCRAAFHLLFDYLPTLQLLRVSQTPCPIIDVSNPSCPIINVSPRVQSLTCPIIDARIFFLPPLRINPVVLN